MENSNSVPVSNSRNGAVKVPQKRPRPVLSCLECRRKKLRCDRQSPCARCLNGGRSAQCSYNESAFSAASSEQSHDATDCTYGTRSAKAARVTSVEAPSDHGAVPRFSLELAPSTPVKVGVIEDLQSRLCKLEQQFAHQSPASDQSRHSEAGITDRRKYSHISSVGVLHFKGSSTRYHGQNQKVALLNHVSPSPLKSLSVTF